MTDWRKWLDELEKAAVQIELLSGGGEECLMSVQTGLVREIVQGYRLLAEAVEQLENSLYLRGDDEYVCPDPECRRPPKEGHDAYCKLGPALALLRGVGRA